MSKDNVNSPEHYTQAGIECIDAITAAVSGKSGVEAVCVANVIKYLWRYELKNGVEVKLPEEEPARALARLAEADRDTRLLNKDILSVDMRFADRIIVRLSEESAQARAETLERKTEKLKRRG